MINAMKQKKIIKKINDLKEKYNEIEKNNKKINELEERHENIDKFQKRKINELNDKYIEIESDNKKNYIQERMYILEKDNNFTWLNLGNKIKDSSLSNDEI